MRRSYLNISFAETFKPRQLQQSAAQSRQAELIVVYELHALTDAVIEAVDFFVIAGGFAIDISVDVACVQYAPRVYLHSGYRNFLIENLLCPTVSVRISLRPRCRSPLRLWDPTS